MKQIVLLALLTLNSFVFADWMKITSAGNSYFNDIYIEGNVIYAVSQNTGVYRSTDGTASWQQLNSGLNNPQAIQCHQIVRTLSNLFVATVDGIYRSTDDGASWVKKSDGISLGSGATYLFCESVCEIIGVLYTGAYSGIYRSTNDGVSWNSTNITNVMHSWAKNFTLHNGIIFAARESINTPYAYRSTDNGLNWQALNNIGVPTITFLSEGNNLFTGTIHGAWLSTNNGANWVHRAAGLSPDPYNSSFVRANGTLVTSLKFGGSGMYKSTNDGVQWETFEEGLPFLSAIEEIIVHNNKILAATSAGIYERNISELTGVNQVSSLIPADYSLGQNYPNPFNPATKINFSLPKAGYVSVKVYDALGRLVNTVISEDLTAGIYEAEFDASRLTSGIYFYTMNAGGFTQTRRMVLVK